MRLQYSPESFSVTEARVRQEVSEAVMAVWKPTPERKMILKLPDTVEATTPNVYADQIEWMSRNLEHRDAVVISVQNHTEIRGTGA